jgi:hypothetical protein
MMSRSLLFFISLTVAGCAQANAADPARVRTAVQNCGFEEGELLWRVMDDGTVAFGRIGPDAKPPAEAKVRCFADWLKRENIKAAMIGWEQY